MKNILIVSGHTDLNDSVANKTILEELEKELPQAEFDYLDRLYPDFQIDIPAEQEKLVKADVLVLQFPVFWYAIPSLMSRWMEQAFQHGFSHGSTGDKLKGKKLIQYRREDIGFVFQFYNLMQNLTALENVELALQICKDPLDAKTVLEEVGLGERMYNFPAQLSGGEQQRVAIARALAKNPKLLLCDEPTGALDYVTGKSILKLLQDTCHKKGMTVIVITHNSALTPMADRIVRIRNGRVAEMIQNENPTPVEEIEW